VTSINAPRYEPHPQINLIQHYISYYLFVCVPSHSFVPTSPCWIVMSTILIQTTHNFRAALPERNADRIAGCHYREGLLQRMLLLQRGKLSVRWENALWLITHVWEQSRYPSHARILFSGETVPNLLTSTRSRRFYPAANMPTV
jgi:hypothetical protein